MQKGMRYSLLISVRFSNQKFGPEALQHYDAYAASDANDDAQQEQLLLNFLDAIVAPAATTKTSYGRNWQKQKKKSRRCLPR